MELSRFRRRAPPPSDSDDETTDKLLGLDERPFMKLMSFLLSNCNTDRAEAEEILVNLSENHPDSLCLKTSLVHSSPLREMRFHAAILLRQFFTPTSEFYLWPRISPQFQYHTKVILLSALSKEKIRYVAIAKSDTISELACALPDPLFPQFPQLLPSVLYSMCLARSQAPIFVEANLRIFARITYKLADILPERLITLRSILSGCIGHPYSSDVRVAALLAACSFIQCLPPSEDRDKLQSLLAFFYPVVDIALYKDKDEVVVQKVLELLIDFVRAEPNFCRKFVMGTTIVRDILVIAANDQLENGTRHLALEFVITLAEARKPPPGLTALLRKMPLRVCELFAILLEMLVDVNNDMAWLNAWSQGKEPDESGNYALALESLDRLVFALGGNTIVKAAVDVLPDYLNNLYWKKRHAALVGLAQISHGCSKEMLQNLKGIINTVLNSFEDPNLRVRWAAINALGQLLIDLCPALANKFHGRVLPALNKAMEDFENPCIQAHATIALVNFIENCNGLILKPYLDGIVRKLVVLLQQGNQIVQEGAVSALTSSADALLTQFSNYYDAVMPHLMHILTNSTDKNLRMLRAKSADCISVVGLSAGKDKFGEHVEVVMQMLISLRSSLNPDDPATNYVLQAWEVICKCLDHDFLPYMTAIMPSLLESAQLEFDLGIASADSIADAQDSDDLGTETATIRGRRIRYRISILEEKALACNVLLGCIEVLGEQFYPWTKKVALVLAPLIKFNYHEEVRKASARAMPELLHSAAKAIKKGISPDHDKLCIKEMFDFILPELLQGIHKEQDLETCTIILESLKECLKLIATLKGEIQVSNIMEEIKHLFTSRDSRKRERKRIKTKDCPAEDLALINKEKEHEDLILEQIGECLSILIKTSKEAFLPYFDELSVHITPMLESKSIQKKRVLVGIFDDLADQCGDAALKYYDAYLPVLLDACNNNDFILRQSALFGVGICAKFGGSKFKPYCSEALSKIYNVIQRQNALAPDHVLAYDNAVSALGKLCQFHRDRVKAKAVVTWLNCLPIRHDIGEAKVVHEQLCSMVESSDRRLLGENNKHHFKIISVYTEVLSSKPPLVTKGTSERMVNSLKELTKKMSQATLHKTLSSLSVNQQHVLRSVLNC
ncbi:ARM repeat superfamily protein [Rhynchospora pubera]|uniref:ARM repeat superfamily protein n=1 Tax=Rhynchospora pubera TaxID=906938 RepID=A0AAV8HCS0_9POAL|nr:ARM repeat superfamily protein [Rhynchospora pubera]